jgi:hypothetical protein
VGASAKSYNSREQAIAHQRPDVRVEGVRHVGIGDQDAGLEVVLPRPVG